MKKIKFDILFKEKILLGNKTLTIRDEQKLDQGDIFEIIFVKDGEVVKDTKKKIYATCIKSFELDCLAPLNELNNSPTERLIEDCVNQPMAILSMTDKGLIVFVFESSCFGFETKEEAYEYYKNNNLLEKSYFYEFKLKEV